MNNNIDICKVILVLMLNIISIGSFAQEFKVESFKMVSENIESPYLLKDNNDRPCALLYINTKEDGLLFSGDIIGDVVHEGNTYILNVVDGTKRISFVKRGVFPYKFVMSEHISHMRFSAKHKYELMLGMENKDNNISGQINGHDYVDMGTGVYWATSNIDANNIEDIGGYYFYLDDYRQSDVPYYDMDFYEDRLYLKNARMKLDVDIAHSKFGNSWRTPTVWDFYELLKSCRHFWSEKNGKSGMEFVANNGNHLFLPCVTFSNGELFCAYNGGLFVKRYDPNSFEDFGGPEASRVIAGPVRPVFDKPYVKEEWQEEYSQKPDGANNGHYYVDLGLSVCWATSNISSIGNKFYGNKYHWGKTEPTNIEMKFNAYCYDEIWNFDIDESYEKETKMNIKDDVAHIKWNSNWRIPSKEEFEELQTKCEWTWTDNYRNIGISGYIVTSNITGYTDKSIFLPVTAAKDGLYATCNKEIGYLGDAGYMRVGNVYGVALTPYQTPSTGFHGNFNIYMIRPVFTK